MYLFKLCRERVSINWEVSQLMFRDSAFTQGLIEPQAGIMTLKSKGAGKQEKWKNMRGNRKGGRGGSLSHFIFSFSIEVTAAFDGETDYCGISLCSRPLELQISGGQANGVFFIWILLHRRLLRDFLLSSLPLPLPSLSSPCRFPSLRPRIRGVSDLVLGNEIPRDSVHHTMLSMPFALSLSLCLACDISTVCTHRCRHRHTHTHTHYFSLKCIWHKLSTHFIKSGNSTEQEKKQG